MKRLEIPKRITGKAFAQLSKEWSMSPDILLVLPNFTSSEEVQLLAIQVLDKLPDDLANTILCELAEIKITPPQVLDQIFENGDTACRVAVCLRSDLTEEMYQKCKRSDDPNVQQHIINNH